MEDKSKLVVSSSVVRDIVNTLEGSHRKQENSQSLQEFRRMKTPAKSLNVKTIASSPIRKLQKKFLRTSSPLGKPSTYKTSSSTIFEPAKAELLKKYFLGMSALPTGSILPSFNKFEFAASQFSCEGFWTSQWN